VEKRKKKFWEELISYFPLIDTDLIENQKIKGGHRQQGDFISLKISRGVKTESKVI
jgi:hypothetical protein